MKVVEFPDKSEENKRDIQEFFDEVKDNIEGLNVTDAVVVTMTEDGEIGFSASSSYVEAHGLLAIALKSL